MEEMIKIFIRYVIRKNGVDMRKWICGFILFFLFAISSLKAAVCIDWEDIYCDIEFRAAAFFPQEDRFRNLYGDTLPCYQLAVSMNTCSFLELWSSVDYIPGNATFDHCEHNNSKLSLTTWAIGLQWPFYIFRNGKLYFGLGPTIAYTFVRNSFRCHEEASRLTFGGIGRAGFCYVFPFGVVVDIFADYVYQPIDFEKIDNVGGLRTGLGIGLQF